MNVNKMLFLTIFGWFKVISITNGLVYRPESLIISEVSTPNFMEQQKNSFIELYATLSDNLTLDAQDVMNLKAYHLIVFSKRPENLYPEFELVVSFSQKVTKKPYIVIGHNLNSTIWSNVDVYFDMVQAEYPVVSTTMKPGMISQFFGLSSGKTVYAVGVFFEHQTKQMNTQFYLPGLHFGQKKHGNRRGKNRIDNIKRQDINDDILNRLRTYCVDLIVLGNHNVAKRTDVFERLTNDYGNNLS